MKRDEEPQPWTRFPALVLATALAAACGGGTPDGDPVPDADAAPAFPAPAFHHIRVNSVDPERALDWWETFWPGGRRTTVAGLPAFEADGTYLLYNTVDEPAPGAFDPERGQSVPQSAFWTTGPSTDGLALYERLTALDPDGERFRFLPVYTGPDDTEGVPRSGLAPFGDQLLTVAEMAERAAREGASPARDRTSGQDFGYLVDPDGILVEFNGNAATEDLFYGHLHFWHEQPLCAANWYVTHLGVTLPPVRDPETGETSPRPPYDPLRGRDRRRQLSLVPARGPAPDADRERAPRQRGVDVVPAPVPRRPVRPRARPAALAVARAGGEPRRGHLPRPRPGARAPRGDRGPHPGGPLSVRRDPRGAHRGPRRAGAGADRGGRRLNRCGGMPCHAAGRHDESLDLRKPTRRLDSAGPYRLSRNPVYLAFVVFIAGLGCANNAGAVMLAVVPAFAALNRYTIPHEEAYLRRTLGADYDEYAARVRRWL